MAHTIRIRVKLDEDWQENSPHVEVVFDPDDPGVYARGDIEDAVKLAVMTTWLAVQRESDPMLGLPRG